MRPFYKLVVTGFVCGLILLGFMKILEIFTGTHAYFMLFNVDYIPLFKQWDPVLLSGMVFHFLTCIASVVGLYYMLRPLHRENWILPYVLVYSAGGGVLYLLAGLTPSPPAVTDLSAWSYWTLGHGVFGLSVGMMAKYWVVRIVEKDREMQWDHIPTDG